jgi:hypothetical protein
MKMRLDKLDKTVASGVTGFGLRGYGAFAHVESVENLENPAVPNACRLYVGAAGGDGFFRYDHIVP